MDLKVLRNRVDKFMHAARWSCALYWAEKLVSLSGAASPDLLNYVMCLIETEQNWRALSVLRKFPSAQPFNPCFTSSILENSCELRPQASISKLRDDNLLKKHKVVKYLAVKCLVGAKQYEEAVSLGESMFGSFRILNSTTLADGASSSAVVDTNPSVSCVDDGGESTNVPDDFLDSIATEWRVDAGVWLLLGRAYEYLDNRTGARQAYERCLVADVFCAEALQRLAQRHLATPQERAALVDRLPIDEQCGDDEAERQLLRAVYRSTAVGADLADSTADGGSDWLRPLNDDSSILATKAERLYYACDFIRAYDLTSIVLKREEFRFDCLLVHICCLVRLEKVNELFRLAHRLVDVYPDHHVSWFAVASYYWATGQFDASKRFFHKCTLLDAQSGEAWIGYGHAFAAEQEHDQAMNCYVKAAKLMTSSHVPLLYVGLEYTSSNGLKLGAKFLSEAARLSPDEPHVLHELGVLYFRLENFIEAEGYMRQAINSLTNRQKNGYGSPGVAWEPLFNNIGHVLRKSRRYEEAEKYHLIALRLKPREPSTLAALGYCNMFLERYETAVDFFHQALASKRDDTFVAAMLTRCMEIASDQNSLSALCFDSVPKFPPPATVYLINGSRSSSVGSALSTVIKTRKGTPKKSNQSAATSLLDSKVDVSDDPVSGDWISNTNNSSSLMDVDMEL